MSKRVLLTPLQRKNLAPAMTAEERRVAAAAVVIDEQTYWTGKDFSFGLDNTRNFTRWYRVAVTNLEAGTEYIIFTQDGRLDESRLVEVEAGGQLDVTIILGGDSEIEPNAPREFEIYVQEYPTPNENGPSNLVFNEKLRWIPKPNKQNIYVTLDHPVVKVRPWQREAHFEVSLVNRSYLPLTAEVYASPLEGGKEAGLEGTQTALQEALPPQNEQPVNCVVTVPKRLKTPIQMAVEADYAVPALGVTDQHTEPQSVVIEPLPFFKVWYDWLLVALAALLLFTLLFGMPPIVHPATRLTLKFDNSTPPGNSGDLAVTLIPTPSNPGGATLPPCVGVPVPVRGAYVYDFNWGWMWKGFRWGWAENDLNLKVEATKQKELYVNYSLGSLPIPDGKIRSSSGVSNSELTLEVGKKGTGLAVVPEIAPENAPSNTDQILIHGTVIPHGGGEKKDFHDIPYVKGKPFTVPCSQDDLPVDINIIAETGQHLRGLGEVDNVQSLDSHPRCIIKFSKLPSATINIPAGNPQTPYAYTIAVPGQPVIKQQAQKGEACAVTIPMTTQTAEATLDIQAMGQSVLHKVLPITAGMPVDAPVWVPPASPIIGGNPLNPPTSGGGSTKPPITGGPSNPTQANNPSVDQACKRLLLGEYAQSLNAEQQKVDHLDLQFRVIKQELGEVKLILKPNKGCWVQVYGVYKSNPGAKDTVFLKSDGSGVKAPLYLNQGQEINYPYGLDKGVDAYIVLGWAQPPTPEVQDDLITVLKTEQDVSKVTGWAIQLVPVPSGP